MGALAQAKNGDKQFWKEKFRAANGKAQHALEKCLDFILFKFWEGGRWGVFFSIFLCGRGRERKIYIAQHAKRLSTVHMESGQSLSIGKGRDEKASGWGLQLCFGFFFVWYKMGRLKDVAREAKASLLKDLKNLLEASMIIIGV
jgi:hypothetical protein